ncbi:hypothetical protein GE061_020255 [Apolygus lucorum]|uniref:C2H2-type domain-containing protein n=1 Tax=Apolygus lucorum TaxID=248454 RepID=A0A8S9WM76_APOLU|nr:hypothetical protein GE061_020255 [Apolygus lucorum]
MSKLQVAMKQLGYYIYERCSPTGAQCESVSRECVFFEGRFYCGCGKSYKHKESWYSHKKYECGVEPRFQCSECPYKARQKQHLKSHVYLKHKKSIIKNQFSSQIPPLDGRLHCFCGMSFVNSVSLEWHTKHICKMRPRFRCIHCPFRAIRKSQLRSHLLTRHMTISEGINPKISMPKGKTEIARGYYIIDGRYHCMKCGKNYAHNGSWYHHKNYECGKEAQFQCPDCPYKAKKKGNLKMHVAAKHKETWTEWIGLYYSPRGFSIIDGRVRCACGKNYKHKVSWYHHKKYECGKEPQFVCSYCPYKAKQKVFHYFHDGRHFCICGGSFKTRDSLNHHRKYCGKEPQFQCPDCPYKARQKGNLKTHVLLTHHKPFI